MKKMKPCPFCGAKAEARYPFLGPIHNGKTFVFDHHCAQDNGLTICIQVYGKTEDEVIKRWNGRCEDGKKYSAK